MHLFHILTSMPTRSMPVAQAGGFLLCASLPSTLRNLCLVFFDKNPDYLLVKEISSKVCIAVRFYSCWYTVQLL